MNSTTLGVLAYIGLGSNLSNPHQQILSAIGELSSTPGIHVVGQSSLYVSAPMGYTEQPDFINAVVALRTPLPAETLLKTLLCIEQSHGRIRAFTNAPRNLDLDLLLYGNERIEAADLSVPHPRLHERAFVLLPLIEISPEVRIPGKGRAKDWVEKCGNQSIRRLADSESTD